MKLLRKENGFTLVEMMIVLVIIGIIVAMAIPSIMASRETAWRQACDGNIRGLNAAAAMYFVQTKGTYPSSANDLTTAVEGFDNPIMEEVPSCPKSGSSYTFTEDNVFECPTHGAAEEPAPAP